MHSLHFSQLTVFLDNLPYTDVTHDVISGSSIPYSGLRALTHMVAAGEGPPNKYIPQYDSRLNLGLFTAQI